MNKSELRKSLRLRRTAIGHAERRCAAIHLMRNALRHGLLIRYQRIGIYLAHGTEINTLPLINRVLKLNRACYLPMLSFGRGKMLWFNRLQSGQTWVTNRFGIPENTTTQQLHARQLDLLFMPLVGFDDSGNRIGMGGGFYDTTLAYLRRRNLWRKPYLVGVAFECQRINGELPYDPWDVPLDAVLTEQGLYRFKRRNTLPVWLHHPST
jgi:5-formyltetrahydrofolate cyclo-ligase